VLGGAGEQLAPFHVGRRHLVEQLAVGLGTAGNPAAVVALALDLAGKGHARGHLPAALARRRQRQIGGRDRRHFDMLVDAIEERARDLRLIVLRAFGSAASSKWPKRQGRVALCYWDLSH